MYILITLAFLWLWHLVYTLDSENCAIASILKFTVLCKQTWPFARALSGARPRGIELRMLFDVDNFQHFQRKSERDRMEFELLKRRTAYNGRNSDKGPTP